MVAVHGFDAYSTSGRQMLAKMRDRRNESKTAMTGEASLGQKLSESIISCTVDSSRLLFDESYIGRLSRPKVLTHVSITAVSGDELVENEPIDQIKFVYGAEPRTTFLYELSDVQIKHLIDAGLYSNPRFEQVFNKLMTESRFEFSGEVEVVSSMLDSIDEPNKVLPLITVNANNVFAKPLTGSDMVTSFDLLLADVSNQAFELRDDLSDKTFESEDVFVDHEIFAADEFEKDTVIDLDDDPEFDVKLEPDDKADEYAEITASIDDVDALDAKTFGKSSEDDMIREIKERARRNRGLKSSGSGNQASSKHEFDEAELDL